MEHLMNPEVELYPDAPDTEAFGLLHIHMMNLKPLLTCWRFEERMTDGVRPGVAFTFGDGFTGRVMLEQEELVVEVYAGICPMDADALRMMLRHKAWWRWMTRGASTEKGVLIYLNVRHPLAQGLDELTDIIVSGVEMAYKQRAELDVWWSRLRWAVGETQA